MPSRRLRILTALGLLIAFAILSWWLLRPRPLPATLLPIRVGDRLLAVRTPDEEWGLFTREGEEVAAPEFDSWFNLGDEIGVLESNDRLLYIRADGSVIWDNAIYAEAE